MEDVKQDSVVEETVSTEQLENIEDVDTDVNALTIDEITTSTEEECIEIGGEKYTYDEIKEFRQGYLRQSDYTKKTQELAKQRKETQDAVELYEYLRNNPYLLQNLEHTDVDPNIRDTAYELRPEMQRLQELEMRFVESELNREINNLKDKYPDFDEVKVLREADIRGVTDLEFVYKALREDDNMDADKIKQEAVEEAKKQIMAELKKNKDTTTTVIDNKSPAAETKTITLSSAQKRVAKGMGISEDEYALWMGKK